MVRGSRSPKRSGRIDRPLVVASVILGLMFAAGTVLAIISDLRKFKDKKWAKPMFFVGSILALISLFGVFILMGAKAGHMPMVFR